MAVTRIYALLDEKGRVRYVGKTNRSLEVRLSAHLRKAKYEQTHKDRWIVSMFRKQKLPTIQMIEMVNGDGCIEERKWIAFFRSIGVKLTNLTDGGDGLTGHIKSKETCKKLSDAHKGKIFSVEHKKNIGKASKGRPAWNKGKIGIYSEATRKKMGADKIGKKISEETRQKLRGRLSWLKGKHLPLVVRQKISKTRKALGLGSPMDGKRHTEKTKQKLIKVKTKLY